MRYRKGPPFKGEPAFVWTVSGEKGELRLVSPAGAALQANVYGDAPVTIDVHDFDTDEVVPVEWEWAAWQLGDPGRRPEHCGAVRSLCRRRRGQVCHV